MNTEQARKSLNTHVAERGAAIQAAYGPRIGHEELARILEDRTCVRYSCEIVFDDGLLLPGECAHPIARSDRPEDGFTMFVHPYFEDRVSALPYVVLYQLVLVNYGDFASAHDAETFGAASLGISKNAYYEALCEMADAVTVKSSESSDTITT